MTWADFFKTLAGPVIGVAIAFAVIWLKEWLDKKKSVQSWFEQHYIMEGVDALTSYFVRLEASIIGLQLSEILGPSRSVPNTIEEISPEVIARLESILQDKIFLVSASFIRSAAMFEYSDESLRKRVLQECLKLAKRYSDTLKDLRVELLNIRLNRKTDLYRIADTRKAVRPILDRMHADHIEAISKLDIHYETDGRGHLLMELQ
jgi:hypothetical protein